MVKKPVPSKQKTIIKIGNLTSACVPDIPDTDLLILLGARMTASFIDNESIFFIES